MQCLTGYDASTLAKEMFIVEEHTVRTGREHLNIAIVFVFSNKNNVVTVTAGKGIIIIPLCFTKCIDRY